ncbi:hypothetical protein 162322226 [Organic Lake phycodnavirus 1]|jgi:hypothetical protein|nr:hypothetical protein 162322226 [Organic Lake phycodnavirus 1]
MKITFFVLLLALLIVYINQVNVVETLKDKIYLYIFNSLSILFVLIFLYYSFVFGFKRGLFSTFIIWCLFVVATPIPEAGLLVSVPLKNILNIDMGITQILVSFIALGFLIFSYVKFRKYLEQTTQGKFLIRIMDFGSFSIFITSILASVSLSYLINDGIDNLVFKKEMNIWLNSGIFWIFLFFFILYFYFLKNLPYK